METFAVGRKKENIPFQIPPFMKENFVKKLSFFFGENVGTFGLSFYF
jgi:hypothetical protein